MNRSPLGACAMAGTSFPINREYTAQLLGFDGIITNTLDAVATRDYLLELAADFSTMGSTLSRFAQDLYLLVHSRI
ncbi:MAG: lyase family protein [Enterocloster bolteae]